MSIIFLDVHESEELEKALSKRVRVTRHPLNEEGYADIYWVGLYGSYQTENKSVSEVIGNQEHVEGQLAKQYYAADYSHLMIRGIAAPSYTNAGTACFERTGNWFRQVHSTPAPYYGYRAWLNGLERTAIDVIEVPDIESVAVHTVAMFEHSYKVEHKTLQNYYREKIIIRNKSPHILALMYLSLAYGLNIGEDRATKLIETYGSLFKVLNATPEELAKIEGIGKKTASKLSRYWKMPKFTRQSIPGV